jgi:hypothetical protein
MKASIFSPDTILFLLYSSFLIRARIHALHCFQNVFFFFFLQESPITGNGYSPSVVHRVAPASPRYIGKLLIDNSTIDPNVFGTVDSAAQSIGSQMARQTFFPNKFRVFLGNSSSVSGTFGLSASASGSQSNQYLISTTGNAPMVTIERNEYWLDFYFYFYIFYARTHLRRLDLI